MKVLIRCVLAIGAVVAWITLIRNDQIVHAQQCCTNNYCSLPPPGCPNTICNRYSGTCSFYWTCESPIIIDVKDQGFHLTDQADGLHFQVYGDKKQQVAWTDPKYGDAWLAVDRNGNGTIDNATELFGNETPQPSLLIMQMTLRLAVACYGTNVTAAVDVARSAFARHGQCHSTW